MQCVMVSSLPPSLPLNDSCATTFLSDNENILAVPSSDVVSTAYYECMYIGIYVVMITGGMRRGQLGG